MIVLLRTGLLAHDTYRSRINGVAVQAVLWIVLATMVFAVCLDVKREDFALVAQAPRGVAAGVVAQFALLPVATWGATLALDLPAPVEAAMLLVACCPGGAISNVMTKLGGGNLALSLSISAVSNVLALVLTPLNFSWTVATNPNTAAWARSIAMNPMDLVVSLVLLLGVPLALAMLLRASKPALADAIKKPLERFTLVALALFIVAALSSQFKAFLVAITVMLPWVVAHNALGLGLGFLAARTARLSHPDMRAVVIESGMQNSGLALGIITAHFAADAQMTAVAGLWGVWHIVSGASLARWWHQGDAKARAALNSATKELPLA